MRLYVADYIADTQDFSCEEHGAYLMLIMHYWRTGGLPDDDERLARIAKLSAERWQCVRIALIPKFGPKWRHKRIESEREKAEDKSLKAAISAAKSWEARGKLPRANAKRGHAPSQSELNASQPSYKSTSSTFSRGDPVRLSELALSALGNSRGAK